MNVVQLPPPAWRDRLQISSNGSIKNNLFNALAAIRGIRRVSDSIFWDEFRSEIMVRSQLPWSNNIDRPWSEYDDIALTEHLQGASLPCTLDMVQRAIGAVAQEQALHPLRKWLETIVWDGRPRISDWLTYYLGADQTPYVQAVGRAWLISAVARVIRPGCKADNILILDGEQGVGKSTALRILAGDRYFTDELADPGSRDAAMQMCGVWIIEISELAAFNSSAIERLKAFVTRTTDRIVPKYERRTKELPRQCVFAGTSNSTEFRDHTGNRRFWPVNVRALDREALAADRAQIWAEAVAAYHAHEPWWLTDQDIITFAKDEQSNRMQIDPWDEIIDLWLQGRFDTSVNEILSECLKLAVEKWTRSEEIRVSKALKIRGWERYRGYSNGLRPWRYRLVSN